MTLMEVLRAGLIGIAALAFSVASMAQTAPSAHPHVGQALDTRTGTLVDITEPAFVRAVFPCGAITLLGEVHDNPQHHAMRAALVKAAVSEGRVVPANCGQGAFVFEHISEDHQDVVERFEARAWFHPEFATAAELLRRLDWENSGWPAAKIFEPLFAAVIAARLKIYAGGPSRDLTRRVAKEGIAALGIERARQLGLNQPMEAGLDDALLNELEASHCGLMPKSAFTNMAVAQRYRDTHMADVALKAAEAHGSVIIFAGNGHVRSDRGIAAALRRIAPDRTVISVTFAEVGPGKGDPRAYVPRDPAGMAATDYVVFANPAARTDPCEAMRAVFKGKER